MSLSPATFLPIVSRELRVAARRRGTYWNRTLAAIVAIAIFVLLGVVGISLVWLNGGQTGD